jgi:hypothetical protein
MHGDGHALNALIEVEGKARVLQDVADAERGADAAQDAWRTRSCWHSEATRDASNGATTGEEV